MTKQASLLIDQYRMCRQSLTDAIADGCTMEQLKELDGNMTASYDAVLACNPSSPEETQIMVEFLLDQLAYFSDMNYDQPELVVIKRIVANLAIAG